MAHLGALVTRTGTYTGRSAGDKFVVREPSSEDKIWWGDYNRPIEPGHFDGLKRRLHAYLQGRDVFVQDCYAGADPDYRLRVRVISEHAWHSFFARNMFLREFDDRYGWAKWSCASCAEWLAWRCGLSVFALAVGYFGMAVACLDPVTILMCGGLLATTGVSAPLIARECNGYRGPLGGG